MAGGAFKKKLLREMERDLKRKHAGRMKQLREQVRQLHAERRKRLKAAKRACDASVHKAADKAQREFKRARQAALKAQKAATLARNTARKARKAGARDKCRLDRSAIEAETTAKLEATQKQAAEVRRYRAELEAGERMLRAKGKAISPAKRSARRGEKRQESDDLVRHNIEPHLQPLWEKRKRYTRADARRSRTEVFMDWVSANPEAVAKLQMQQQPTPKQWAAAEEAYHRERGTLADEEVPF